jgi:hypothetical protein
MGDEEVFRALDLPFLREYVVIGLLLASCISRLPPKGRKETESRMDQEKKKRRGCVGRISQLRNQVPGCPLSATRTMLLSYTLTVF